MPRLIRTGHWTSLDRYSGNGSYPLSDGGIFGDVGSHAGQTCRPGVSKMAYNPAFAASRKTPSFAPQMARVRAMLNDPDKLANNVLGDTSRTHELALVRPARSSKGDPSGT
jgi:hypothetical protein